MENPSRDHPNTKRLMKNTIANKKQLLTLLFLIFTFYCFPEIKPLKYFTPVEIKKANTASAVKYLSATEKETLMIINLARLYPKKFLKFYHAYAATNVYGSKAKLKTNRYYTTLTADLQKLKPMQALKPDIEMYKLAKCWATEAGKSGATGHKRTNCTGGYYAECCEYGSNNALDIVMNLLIDEGVESLGHRRICLSSSYKLAGISKQPHSAWRTNTVLDFTHKTADKGSYASK